MNKLLSLMKRPLGEIQLRIDVKNKTVERYDMKTGKLLHRMVFK